MEQTSVENQDACALHHRAIRDTLDVLSGKWKLPIIGSLIFGKKGFNELKNHMDGIASKMLSRELQELEMNGFIIRTVMPTKPITVQYELTEYGLSIKPMVDEMAAWGIAHRERLRG